MNDKIQLFEEQQIRTAWDKEKEEWYFSVVDVVGVLTEQKDYDGARNYWKVLKTRIKEESAIRTDIPWVKTLCEDCCRKF